MFKAKLNQHAKQLFVLVYFICTSFSINTVSAQTTFEFNQRKYKKALFTKAELAEYRQQLLDLIRREKPYLNPNLSLRDLAQQK